MALLAFKLIGLQAMLGGARASNANLNSDLETRMEKMLEFAVGAAQEHIVGKRSTNPPELLGIGDNPGGRLRQSITSFGVNSVGGEIVGTFGPQAVVYAATHEFGDESRGIRARPYLATGLEDIKGDIERELGEAFKGSVLA